MWWRRPLALLFLLCLAGCGFRPLYGTGSAAADPAVMDELASVDVAPLANHQGQMIHNALLTDLTPHGEAEHPKYVLRVNLVVNDVQQAISTTYSATRDFLYYTINYYLYQGSTIVTAGSFSQTYSYDFLPDYYANVSTSDDLKRRASLAIADEIRNRLAAYFTKAAEVKKDAEAKKAGGK